MTYILNPKNFCKFYKTRWRIKKHTIDYSWISIKNRKKRFQYDIEKEIIKNFMKGQKP